MLDLLAFLDCSEDIFARYCSPRWEQAIVMLRRDVGVLVCWSQFSRPRSIVCNCMLEGHGILPSSRRRQFSSTSNHGEKQNDQPRGFRVLFPRALPNPKGNRVEERIQLPRSISGWRRVFSLAWRDYCITWEGFFGSKEDESKEIETREEAAKSEMKEIIESQKEAVRGNVKRNVAFLKEEGPKFLQFMKDETKIYTKEDLKEWAGEQLKLATQCVKEFMAGYRNGRDEEVDKMLNEYFKEEDDEKEADAPERKRRKPKRLVRKA